MLHNTELTNKDYFIFSFNFFLLSEQYIILHIKKVVSSLKDLLTYKKSKNLIYIKLK